MNAEVNLSFTSRVQRGTGMDPEEIIKDEELLKLAAEYADLMSIQTDLAFVKRACLSFLELDPNDDNRTLTRALWSSAVIAYRRTFTTGKGLGLVRGRPRFRVPTSVIDALEDHLKFAHRAALEEGDKHIAHRTSHELDQFPVHLLFDKDPSGAMRITGIASMAVSRIAPPPEEVELLGKVADVVGIAIGDMARKKQEEVLARGMAIVISKTK